MGNGIGSSNNKEEKGAESIQSATPCQDLDTSRRISLGSDPLIYP
jgi:hypothetical protein